MPKAPKRADSRHLGFPVWDRSLLYSLVALLKQDSIASPSVDFTPFELTAADDIAIAAPISILYTLISVCDEIDSHPRVASDRLFSS